MHVPLPVAVPGHGGETQPFCHYRVRPEERYTARRASTATAAESTHSHWTAIGSGGARL
uniref:hypothetical protein n=1 Tax=Burkholderia vietnamiensis TaxID=60552 RepID=UPI003855EB52